MQARATASQPRAVPRLPCGQAAGQGDAVQGHIRVVVRAEFSEAILAERPEAQRGPVRGGGKDAGMLHEHPGRDEAAPGRRGRPLARWTSR